MSNEDETEAGTAPEQEQENEQEESGQDDTAQQYASGQSEAQQEQEAEQAFQEESVSQREKREKAERVARSKESKKKAAAKTRAPQQRRKKEKTHLIKLHNNPEIPPNGQYVGVNGRWMLLKPNVEMEVPESVLEVLDNAVRHEAEKDEHNRVVGTREVPRFPYTFVRRPRADADR